MRTRAMVTIALVAVTVLTVHPSLSAAPKGRLAFSAWEHEQWRLYLADADGRHRVRVPASWAFDVEYAPDGQRVAFFGQPSPDSTKRALMTVRRDGSGRQVLLSSDEWPRSPSWSPDGRRIVYSVYEGLPSAAAQPPFGVGHWQSHCRLDVVDVATGRTETLLHSGASAGAADYLGDWAEVAVGCALSPKWSPKGDLIAFVADVYAGGTVADRARGPVMTIRPDGTDLRPLTGTRSFMGVDFSPDGSRIAYGWAQRDDDASALQLRTVAADGSDDRLVADLGPRTEVGFPAYSPDGSTILAQVEDYNREGLAQLYRFPASGGRGVPVVLGKKHFVIPDWHR
jgi:Tol biopolymer transport system component